MSVEKFQEAVKKHEGYILSDGTLNYEHLLAKAYDCIVGWEIESDIPKEIIELFAFEKDYAPEDGDDISLRELVYFGHAELKEDSQSLESASWIWNETLYNFFDEMSPDGYYFGGSEGDGACIGWFKDSVCMSCGEEFDTDEMENGLCEVCGQEEIY